MFLILRPIVFPGVTLPCSKHNKQTNLFKVGKKLEKYYPVLLELFVALSDEQLKY